MLADEKTELLVPFVVILNQGELMVAPCRGGGPRLGSCSQRCQC